jgi:hypothetical protein
MGFEDEPTDEYRFIGRARPPEPPADPERGWDDDPPMPVDDVPMSRREATSRVDKQRNQRR